MRIPLGVGTRRAHQAKLVELRASDATACDSGSHAARLAGVAKTIVEHRRNVIGRANTRELLWNVSATAPA